uniref:abl interactor 2-like isoform X2 n=1 Tax=Myxine glutinosa TaxID=7769 RepID=UPI00358FB60E
MLSGLARSPLVEKLRFLEPVCPSCTVSSSLNRHAPRSLSLHPSLVHTPKMAELQALVQVDIPTIRAALIDCHFNLGKVADYCEHNYQQAENKERALNETRAFATQSLASVAYQIDSGASRLLLMLDTQEALLRQLGASVNHISQCVAVHKEKVSRREIGVLTTSKRPPRHTKLVAPPSHPPHGSTRYLRTKINYSVLDHLGHGAKTMDDNEHSLASHSIPPSQKPPSPPIHHKPLNRHSPFRTMDPSRPPVIPNEYSASPTRSAVVRPRAYSSGSSSAGSRDSVGSGGGLLPLPVPTPTVPPMAPLTNNHSHAAHTVTLVRAPSRHGPGSYKGQQSTGATHNGPSNFSEVLGNHIGPASLPPPSFQLIPQLPLVGFVARVQETNCAQGEVERREEPETEEKSLVHYHDPFAYTDPPWAPKHYTERVVAMYDYNGERSDELSFEEGTVIFVVKKNADGWYEGTAAGVTGLFPGNYVETIAANPRNSSPAS